MQSKKTETKIESAFLTQEQTYQVYAEAHYMFQFPLDGLKLSVWRLSDQKGQTLSIGINAFASTSGSKKIKTVYKIKVSAKSFVKVVFYPDYGGEDQSTITEFQHDDNIFYDLNQMIQKFIKENAK